MQQCTASKNTVTAVTLMSRINDFQPALYLRNQSSEP
jgi:hypothetical protein